MYGEDFSDRLSKLRNQKGVSARDMSLSIGQNPCYINNIENGKALPSMSAFFFICDYLGITPREFFETNNSQPLEMRKLVNNLKKLSPDLLKSLNLIVDNLIENKENSLG